MKLYKTTIVIWSDYDPSAIGEHDIAHLAKDATDGDSYCSKSSTVAVEKPEEDPDWDGTEFFNDPDDEEGA